MRIIYDAASLANLAASTLASSVAQGLGVAEDPIQTGFYGQYRSSWPEGRRAKGPQAKPKKRSNRLVMSRRTKRRHRRARA